MNPRRAAFAVLTGLERGPHLETLLGRALASAPASERAFASSLVFTVLRNRLYLDHLLAACLDRPLTKLDPPVLAVLRLGAAELALMSTPDHAAVSAAVELAQATPARRGQTLINAVLRRLARSWQAVPLPPAAADPAAHLALRFSHPLWLVQELLAQWPAEFVADWLAANQQPPPLTLRANTLKATREDLAARLAASAGEVAPHPLTPEGLVLRGAAAPAAELPGFNEGLFQVQDAAAQAVSHLLGVRPGMAVADLCAGAGGKTGHLAALLGGGQGLLAVEPSPGRVRALKENLGRLGVAGVRIVQADALTLTGLGPFDRVLVDAPCSALGVVGRRPDVRWRRTPEDPARLAELQLALAEKAVDLLAPGGALVYCTCTVTRTENADLVAALLAARPGLRLEWPQDLTAPLKVCIGPDGFFRSFPHQQQSDAFFAARLVRGAQV